MSPSTVTSINFGLAGGGGNEGFVGAVGMDDEVGIFGAVVGLAESFFDVFSIFVFEETPPGACEATGGFFPKAWVVTAALLLDPPKVAFLFSERGVGETPPPPPR